MKIKGAQLFVRLKIGSLYLVCGLVNTDQNLEEGTILTATGDLDIILKEDKSAETAGMGLDGVIQAPIWRLKNEIQI